MPLDIDKLYKSGLVEKPFFAQNIRGDIFFCDYMSKKIDPKSEEYYLVDSYNVYAKSPKCKINSCYLDLYTKPLIISNSKYNNMLLFTDKNGNILLTTKEDFNDTYSSLYYVDVDNTKEHEIGDTDYYTGYPNGDAMFEILPPSFKIRVDFNHK